MPELADAYEQRLPLLQELAERMERDLVEHLQDQGHVDRISFRAKGLDSFVRKSQRDEQPYDSPLAEVEDQIAGRVLVLFLSDVEPVQAAVETAFQPVELELKRPTKYNEFDYESFHGVYAIPPQHVPAGWGDLTDMPQTFELQVRTLFQHAYAEPQHDLGYKPEGPLDEETRRQLAWIAASSWGADQALERVRSHLDS